MLQKHITIYNSGKTSSNNTYDNILHITSYIYYILIMMGSYFKQKYLYTAKEWFIFVVFNKSLTYNAEDIHKGYNKNKNQDATHV